MTSEYIPVGCVAAESGRPRASASLEASEALVSWSKESRCRNEGGKKVEQLLPLYLKQQHDTLHLLVLSQQVVAEAWMEVLAYPKKERDQIRKTLVSVLGSLFE